MVRESAPLVSVGLPTFNRPDELRRCLEEIVNQSYKNLEIIVSDNASPGHEVFSIVNEFRIVDERISYFRQHENIGAASNFQFVLAHARGEFFMWAADDDYRASNFIEILVNELISRNDCSIAFCDFAEVDRVGSVLDNYPDHLPLLTSLTSRLRPVRLVRFFFQLESKGKANLIYGLIRHSALEGFEWELFQRENGQYGADMLFVFRLLQKGGLVISRQKLYRCTVGNIKQYHPPVSRKLASRLLAPISELKTQLAYSFRYARLTGGLIKPFFYLLWPLKALDIFGRLFLLPAFTNLFKKIRLHDAL